MVWISNIADIFIYLLFESLTGWLALMIRYKDTGEVNMGILFSVYADIAPICFVMPQLYLSENNIYIN